ncbi:MAG: hypothetical protein ACRD8O_16130 [Bryobacteraceae bacterium]
MTRCVAPLGILLATLVHGAGTEPRATAAEYPAHAPLPPLSIGAEYMVRSVPGSGQTILVSDYLVVEVALFSTAREMMVNSGAFTLRINGKKQAIVAQTPAFVAASLKHPDWEHRRGVIAQAGPIVVGRPQTTERFPGDQRPSQTRLPRPPQAPDDPNRSGLDPEPVMKPEEIVIQSALVEGRRVLPLSGCLYFAHKGKPQSIRTVDLIYEGPEGTVTLPLKK